MIRGLVAYVLTLLCGGAFYLFYPGYLSFYTLALLLSLPLLSLAMTLLGRRRLALTLRLSRPEALRGEEVFARFSLSGPAGEWVLLTYRVENLLYPHLTREKTVKLRAGRPLELTLPTDHCGWLKLTVRRCRTQGWLGILSLPLPAPEAALARVSPRPGRLPPGLDLTPDRALPLRPKPGGGPGEEHELRPYRPGDPVKSIHWKLTAKQPSGEPILRETMERPARRLVVSYDHFGPPQVLDAVLDQLWALALEVIDKGDSFTLLWTDPATGAVTSYDVNCPKAWQQRAQTILAQPAPLLGVSLPAGKLGLDPSVKLIRLTAENGEGAASR